MFSCEFCEIFKSSYLYRTQAVAASVAYHLSFSRLNKILNEKLHLLLIDNEIFVEIYENAFRENKSLWNVSKKRNQIICSCKITLNIPHVFFLQRNHLAFINFEAALNEWSINFEYFLTQYNNGSMMEKEIQLLFVSDISFCLSYFLFLYMNDFLMV